MKLSEALAERLRWLMAEKNITAAEVCKGSGLAMSTVYNILNARSDACADLLCISFRKSIAYGTL